MSVMPLTDGAGSPNNRPDRPSRTWWKRKPKPSSADAEMENMDAGAEDEASATDASGARMETVVAEARGGV